MSSPDGPRNSQRRHLRLKGYDYSQPGAYFVTIVTQARSCLFGEIRDGKMSLNESGEMVRRQWENLTSRLSNIKLDAFIVMPNHLHGIIVLNPLPKSLLASHLKDHVGAPLVGAQAPPISESAGANESTGADPRATTRVAPTLYPTPPLPQIIQTFPHRLAQAGEDGGVPQGVGAGFRVAQVHHQVQEGSGVVRLEAQDEFLVVQAEGI